MASQNFEDSFDWEEYSGNIPFKIHMIAGSFAGLAEHVLMYPFDTIKTQLQSIRNNQSMTTIIKEMYNYQGFSTYFRGLAAVFLSVGPSHAAQFGIYEYSRTKLGIDNQSSYKYFYVGICAQSFHDFIMVPFDMIKQNKQISENSYLQIIRNIRNQQGSILHLWRSFPITFLTQAPNTSILIYLNEHFKSLVPMADHSFKHHFLFAGVASSVASMITTPLDVVKTKLQIQSQTSFLQKNIQQQQQNSVKYVGTFDTIKTILVEEGIKGFFKGGVPRMLMQAPGAAIAWSSYEYFKKSLTNCKYLY